MKEIIINRQDNKKQILLIEEDIKERIYYWCNRKQLQC